MRRQGTRPNFNEQLIAGSAEGLFAKKAPKKKEVNPKEAGEAAFNTSKLPPISSYRKKQSFLLSNISSLSIAEESVTEPSSEHQDSEEQNGNKTQII